ncbi:MAG: hypothetical protein ACF8R7_18215 [Phycisphaerales bacterium JB039]
MLSKKSGSRLRVAPVCGALMLAIPAGAVDIPPGGAAILPGGEIAGTVIRDVSIPFVIRDAGGKVLMQGEVQDRVLKTDAGLAFMTRIRKCVGAAWGIDQVVRNRMDLFKTDCDWSKSSPGLGAPDFCQRSGDGDVLDYSLAFAPIFSGQESKFFWASTDAKEYAVNSKMTLRLQNGYSTTIIVAAPVFDDSAPEVAITDPGAFECGCNPMQIRGTVRDTESAITSWTLEYARSASGPWTLIDSGSGSIAPGGLITTWDATGLQGYHLLRLTATNGVDMTSVVTTAVWVDTAFQNLDLRSPGHGGIYGGSICFDGTAWDHCPDYYRVDYRPAGSGSYVPVDPAHATYPGTVINDPLATWASAAAADGKYEVRLRGVDSCGNTLDDVHTIIVDNTPPIADITSPEPCVYVCNKVVIRGTAADLNLRSWSVQYTGGDEHGWRTIATGSTSVVDDVLAEWDVSRLRPCAYTIRLVVTDDAIIDCGPYTHDVRDHVSIHVGAYADCDGNGVLDFFDFLCFQNAFAAGGP